jgi:hypothetical protein
MEEEFYCIIKLVSSEEIFSLISIDENNEDPIIILHNPVVMNVIGSSNDSSYIKIKPWMEISDDDMFFIKLDKVITMTETNDKRLIELYEYYLNDSSIDDYKPQGQVPLNSEMGYIDSVKDARKKLEDLYKKKFN